MRPRVVLLELLSPALARAQRERRLPAAVTRRPPVPCPETVAIPQPLRLAR